MDNFAVSVHKVWATEEEFTRLEHSLKNFRRGEVVSNVLETDREEGKKTIKK